MNLQYISLLLSAAIFLSSTIEAAGEPDDNEHEGERRRRSSHDPPILRDGKEDEHRHEHNLMNLNIHTSTSMGTSEGVTYNMAGGMPPSGEEDYDDHRFVVKFEEEEFQVELANFKRRLLEDSASTFSPSDDYHEDTVRSAVEEKFLIRENAEIMTLMSDVEVDEMRKRPGVMYVERDTRVHLMQSSSTEITPYGIEQVMALEVNDTFVDNRKVCIIDTGYDRDHLDLPSGDTITGDSFGPESWYQDGNGHGTHVAGTIAALGGNGRGVVGVNRNGKLKLHIVRFLDDGGYAYTSDLVRAVQTCVDNDSNIVNMSLGGAGYSRWEEEAYARMFENQNVLIVAAAGNDGDASYLYPASYDSVVSVGAVDQFERIASFSQYNNEVDIVGPGVDVQSTVPGNRYASFDGTSMAAPHVAGVAALVWSHFPSKTAKEVRKALYDSAKDLGTQGRDDYYGFGLVQADIAYEFLAGLRTATPTVTPVECFDSPIGWHDNDGATYNCVWYSQSDYCFKYGNSFLGLRDKTANEACCACGGGLVTGGSTASPTTSSPTTSFPTTGFPSTSPPTTSSPTMSFSPTSSPSTNVPTTSFLPTTFPTTSSPTTSFPPTSSPSTRVPTTSSLPTTFPTMSSPSTRSPTTSFPTTSFPPTSPPTECVDDPIGWTDGGNDGCEWYEPFGFCEMYGDAFPDANGIDANTACCVCGGASNDDEVTENYCYDNPIGWTDSGNDGCEWYETSGFCEEYGDAFPDVDEIDANMACCVCGGGTRTCEDTSDWTDSWSDGCNWYAVEGRCDTFGGANAGDSGLTANEACCACGGGNS